MTGLGLTGPVIYLYVTIKNTKQKVMKLKKQLPEHEIVFTNSDPFAVNLLISIMKNLGVNIYDTSHEYDPEYPYLIWNGDTITQARTTHYRSGADTIDEFVKHFVNMPVTKTIKLTDDYDVTITADKVKVGCQEIPFEKLEEVWNTMLEIRNM